MRFLRNSSSQTPDEHPEASHIPGWLKNLQENSWEVELLISGGAVFSLFQIPDVFIQWMRSLRILLDFPGFAILVVTGTLGIKILTNGFILHLILRAWWLAMVCLNYIFPQGIRSERVNRRKPFTTKHTEGDLYQAIMGADRICGLVIFMAIVSTVVLCGFLVAFVILLGAMFVFELIAAGHLGEWPYALIDMVFMGIPFYLFDLFSMGLLRKLPVISWLVWLPFRFYDLITLRPLFERALVMFSSNVDKRQFYAGASVFTLVTVLSVYMQLYPVLHWSNLFDQREFRNQLASGPAVSSSNYMDESEGVERGHVYIPSRLVDGNFLEVHLRYARLLDGFIKTSGLPDSLKSLERVIELSLNDSVYQDLTWHRHSSKNGEELGVICMVPIRHLPEGMYLLKIKPKNIQNPEYQQIKADRGQEVKVPFWKEERE